MEWAAANRAYEEYLKAFAELENNKFHPFPENALNVKETGKGWMVIFKRGELKTSPFIEIVLTKNQATTMANDLNEVMKRRGKKK